MGFIELNIILADDTSLDMNEKMLLQGEIFWILARSESYLEEPTLKLGKSKN